MIQIIFNQKSNQEHLESNIYNLKIAAEEMCPKDGKEIYISTSGGNDFKATCYKHIACNHIGSNYDNVIALDWGYAIGESFCGMVGKVHKENNCYFMDIKYYLLDTYEFPVHWDQDVAATGLSVTAHELHEYGLAKEYKIIGVYNQAIAWKENELEDFYHINIDTDFYSSLPIS